ncbi:MAG: DUF1761 domain-containing protein [bacterium]
MDLSEVLPFGQLNWVAILGCVVVSMLLGYAWYAPFGFGKIWMREEGVTAADARRHMARAIGVSALGAVFASVAMAVVLYHMSFIVDQFFYADEYLFNAAVLGLVIGLGFAVPLVMAEVGFAGRSIRLAAVHGGYRLVQFMLIAIILAQWPGPQDTFSP